MKKIILIFVASLFYVVSINAQDNSNTLKKEIKTDRMDGNKTDKRKAKKELRKLEGTEVSYDSQQAFASDFPNMKPVSSKRLVNFDEFTFTKNGKNMTAYYDADNKLVGTTENRTIKSLPLNAQKIIKDKYNGYTIGDVLFYHDNADNNSDMILYDVQFNDNDNYFVQLKKGDKALVLEVDPAGEVSEFSGGSN